MNIGQIVAIEQPAVYQVDPVKRKTTSHLQAFEITDIDGDNTLSLKPTNATPEVYLRLTGGHRFR